MGNEVIDLVSSAVGLVPIIGLTVAALLAGAVLWRLETGSLCPSQWPPPD